MNDPEIKTLIRFHVRACTWASLIILTLAVTLDRTVLRDAGHNASNLAGLGIGATGLLIGYGIELRRLHNLVKRGGL